MLYVSLVRLTRPCLLGILESLALFLAGQDSLSLSLHHGHAPDSFLYCLCCPSLYPLLLHTISLLLVPKCLSASVALFLMSRFCGRPSLHVPLSLSLLPLFSCSLWRHLLSYVFLQNSLSLCLSQSHPSLVCALSLLSSLSVSMCLGLCDTPCCHAKAALQRTTTGLKGGSISRRSSFSQSIFRKNECDLMSRSPSGPQPRRVSRFLMRKPRIIATASSLNHTGNSTSLCKMARKRSSSEGASNGGFSNK